MSNRYVVIMAGGRGERFWPESRLARPKQLLPIVGEKAMLAQTVDRLAGLVSPKEVFVITNAEQRAAVLEVCPELDPAKVIGEPVGRDTAAAVGLATILVKRENPNATFAMLPADAMIHDAAGLCATLESAFAVAEAQNVLATIGITATSPATGYGYIQQGDALGEFADRSIFNVKRFVEKPDAETAQGYLDSGDYFWNAGMFVWSVASIVEQLETNTPALWNALQAIDAGLSAGEAIDPLLAAHYPSLEKISVDYAIIEKASNVVMVESGFDWDDVGEWSAIARHYPADNAGNVVRGTAQIEQGANNIVYCRDDDHLVALLGVDDLIVVKTDDATLVCHKDKAQDIKALVQAIGAKEALKKLM
ncbi:MAG: sugar phosphate nucleotidyltransferase [Opitutales bacterium]|jgi:mannose-1-phosphate guanylyltransferase|nr:sugar phosphate nucleotidyltransferase [Opitutales bacterium]MDP4643766.1 sugar phosphate nucleotidyltransferase [Opitutales bacterium]MDP4777168.1 sugar phosphate nucleotidyltransferase [Opitutales bacterium]MDP4883928.1 sugar phosphate nucleotidyltransferase [Opitutales bacterium]MDP5080322.1 sugar phosphate nucleotidyltransferase [Opitutales bacterium]